MTIEELLREGEIKPLTVDRRNIENSLEIARRDITAAKSILSDSRDWALSISYNAILQSLRAFMFSKGYRPSGEGHHVVTIEFADLFLDGDLMIRIRRMRQRRAASVYDTAGTVSTEAAERSIALAEEVLAVVQKRIAIDHR